MRFLSFFLFPMALLRSSERIIMTLVRCATLLQGVVARCAALRCALRGALSCATLPCALLREGCAVRTDNLSFWEGFSLLAFILTIGGVENN